MARFDLSKYATVAERIQLLYAQYPDARIVTENLTTLQDRSVSTWVVKASLFLSAEDQADGLVKATGHAFEVDGGSGANQTSALENAESSAVGRCLALAGWAANKDSNSLASAEEMQKVERGVTPAGRNWLAEAETLALGYNVDGLLALYQDAVAARVPADVLAQIKDYGVAARG
jgi:hypothetical protein